MIKRKRGRPKKNFLDGRSPECARIISGNENVYYITSFANPDQSEVKIILEFANISWVVAIAKKKKNQFSKFSHILLTKSSHRIRAPNKKTYWISNKSPAEHVEMIKGSYLNTCVRRDNSNASLLLKLMESRFYNYSSAKLNNKQINNKLLTLRKNDKIVTLRIVYELTKSLPKAKKILDTFCHKHGESAVSYQVEDNLIFDYLSTLGDIRDAPRLLETIGVGSLQSKLLTDQFVTQITNARRFPRPALAATYNPRPAEELVKPEKTPTLRSAIPQSSVGGDGGGGALSAGAEAFKKPLVAEPLTLTLSSAKRKQRKAKHAVVTFRLARKLVLRAKAAREGGGFDGAKKKRNFFKKCPECGVDLYFAVKRCKKCGANALKKIMGLQDEEAE